MIDILGITREIEYTVSQAICRQHAGNYNKVLCSPAGNFVIQAILNTLYRKNNIKKKIIRIEGRGNCRIACIACELFVTHCASKNKSSQAICLVAGVV